MKSFSFVEKDVKVIPSEEVFIQHKLVVCDLNIRFEREV